MIALTGWCAFLVAALVSLHATPVAPGDGVEPAFAVVRLVALATGWWLLSTTLVGVAARLVRAGLAVRVLDRITAGFVRSMMNRVAGLALVASMATPVAASAGERPVDPPPVMRLIDGPAPAPPVAAVAPTPPVEAEHVVGAGENLWSISEDVLRVRLARPPSDGEVTRYWQDLMALNADRYEDPDLIFSGQVLRLP